MFYGATSISHSSRFAWFELNESDRAVASIGKEMRYEFKRLDILGTRFPYHPHHNVRHVAMKDAILSCAEREVLVLACGKGIVEYLLPDGIRCLSADISSNEIEAAMEVNRYKPNRQFLVADIFRVEEVLGQQTFPVVAISELIEHLDKDRLALENARRHLRPGGWLVLTVPNTDRFHNRVRRLLGRQPFLMTPDHKREYTVAGARRLLEEIGLVVVRWRGIWFDFPRPYWVEKYISPYSKLRSMLATLFPQSATFHLFVCRSPGPVGLI